MTLRLSALAPASTGTFHLALNEDGSRVAFSNGHLHRFDESLRALTRSERHTGALLWRGQQLLVTADGSPVVPTYGYGPLALAATADGLIGALGSEKLQWLSGTRTKELKAPADQVVTSPAGTRGASWNDRKVALWSNPDTKPVTLTHGPQRKPGESIQESIEHLRATGACFTDEETLWVLWHTWNATVLERRDPTGAVTASVSLHQRLNQAGSPMALLAVGGHVVVVGTQALVVVEPVKAKTVAQLSLKSLKVAFSGDGTRLAAVEHDGALSLFDFDPTRWELTPRATCKPVGRTHTARWSAAHNTLHVIRHQPDEREVWSSHGIVDVKKGTALAIELQPGTGELLTTNSTRTASLGKVKLRGRIGEPSSAAFHPSEPLVTTGAVVFDLTGKEVATGVVSAAVCALPSGRLLTAGPETKLSEVSWQGALIKELRSPPDGWVRWLVASQESEAFTAVTYGHGGSKVFAYARPEATPLELPGSGGAPSPSGKYFATIGFSETGVFDAAGSRLAKLEGSTFWADQAHAVRFATEEVVLVPMGSGSLRLWRWRNDTWLDLLRTAGKHWCVIDESGRVEGSNDALKLVLDGPPQTEGLLASWWVALGGTATPPAKPTKSRASPKKKR
ncbi:MAG: hypothetical protein Q8N23_14925 [Archangium sp.]|nr:hypothetical protein [Archangium sp.]MDP3153964.1 hypothetical protein [Archangium sp.]MDP3574239.1 hypothetical protein [Archangium sp.]